MNQNDLKNLIDRYSRRFESFGYDPRTLGWDKGKQMVRFELLTSQIDLRGKRILDIGCGFGDLNIFLKLCYNDDYEYVGIDPVPKLIECGRKMFVRPGVQFHCGDFLSENFSGDFDYAIASGVFNYKLAFEENYDFIKSVMQKAFALCREGLAFDFLSDKVDYRHEHTFHSSPERILSLAYGLSRNIILRNDCMPFEFAVFINKYQSFEKSDTIFNSYKQPHKSQITK
jgi:SAM-dependent methyltransferase